MAQSAMEAAAGSLKQTEGWKAAGARRDSVRLLCWSSSKLLHSFISKLFSLTSKLGNGYLRSYFLSSREPGNWEVTQA